MLVLAKPFFTFLGPSAYLEADTLILEEVTYRQGQGSRAAIVPKV